MCSRASPLERFEPVHHRDLGKLIISGNQVVPFGEMLVHGLRGGRSNRVGVLPNLRSDVEQRDHYRKSADDLSEIGEIVEIHWVPITTRRAIAVNRPYLCLFRA